MTAGVAPEATFGITTPCRCFNGRRLPPIRVRTNVAARIGAVLRAAGIPLTLIVFEYRCSACEAVVPVSIAQFLGVQP